MGIHCTSEHVATAVLVQLRGDSLESCWSNLRHNAERYAALSIVTLSHHQRGSPCMTQAFHHKLHRTVEHQMPHFVLLKGHAQILLGNRRTCSGCSRGRNTSGKTRLRGSWPHRSCDCSCGSVPHSRNSDFLDLQGWMSVHRTTQPCSQKPISFMTSTL